MPDLSSLFQYSPEVAGFFTGQNQAANLAQTQTTTAELAQRIASQQQADAENAQLFPGKLKQQDLLNQTSEAQLPGVKAKSRLDTNNADISDATKDSDIAVKKSNNEEALAKAAYDQTVRARDTLLQAGPLLSSVPAPLRKQALQSYLEQSGVKWQNSPHLQAILNSDPQQMVPAIQGMAQALGDQALQMSPTARATMYSAKTRSDAEIKAAGIRAGATEKAAQISADARVKAVQAKSTANGFIQGVLSGRFGTDKAMAALTVLSSTTTNPEEKAAYDEANRTIQQIVINTRGAGQNGALQLTPDADGNLKPTPKTITPIVPGGPKKGTAENPIILK